MIEKTNFCVFEYQNRDGGNFKSYGILLLRGQASEDAKERIQATLIDQMFFYEEDVQIPALYEGLWKWGFSTLDIYWHEFIDLRPATDQEITELPCFGDLEELTCKFEKAKTKWQV